MPSSNPVCELDSDGNNQQPPAETMDYGWLSLDISKVDHNKNNYLIDADGTKRWSIGGTGYRVGAAIIALVCMVVLGVARYVEPEARGLGSHQQLGLQVCGFYQRTGYPCPTCGMTTAFAYVVRGQVLDALWVQPAGMLGALACIIGAAVGGYTAITGRCFERYLIGVNPVIVAMWIVVIILVAWGWLCALTYFGLR